MPLTVADFAVEAAASEPMLRISESAGAGLAQLVRLALERASGPEVEARIEGKVQIGDGWRGEIVVSRAGGERSRHVVETDFDEAHHFQFRLAEFAAHQSGRTLPEPAIRAFEDLRTPSPLAMLAYWEGLGSTGATRRQRWMRAFELDPHFVAARLSLAQILLDSGSEPAAAAGLTHGLTVNDGYAAAHLGLDLWAAGAAAAAQEILQAAVRTNPGDALASAAFAALVARGVANDPSNPDQGAALEEALLLATNATQLAADDYRAWAALADVHRAKGDYDQAGFYYGFALKLEPNAPAVLKDAGATWLLARNPQQALPLIKRAIEASPSDAELYGNLAFARDLLHEPAAALEAARQAVELAPANARLCILHGDLALKAGQREKALDAWALAASLEPGITINPEGGNIGLPGEPDPEPASVPSTQS